jgi:hypothetical protein
MKGLRAGRILLTIWVCKDRHAKGVGCGLWVPIILLTGVGGAIFYALVRLGDTRDPSAAPAGEGK